VELLRGGGLILKPPTPARVEDSGVEVSQLARVEVSRVEVSQLARVEVSRVEVSQLARVEVSRVEVSQLARVEVSTPESSHHKKNIKLDPKPLEIHTIKKIIYETARGNPL